MSLGFNLSFVCPHNVHALNSQHYSRPPGSVASTCADINLETRSQNTEKLLTRTYTK